MANWYLFRNGQTWGPYADEQIREWIGLGQLLADEQLCREGEQTWNAVASLPEFSGALAGAPPPPAAAPPAGGTPYHVPQAPYQVPPAAYAPPPGSKDRTVAGILAILLGTFGVHHFYLGNIGIGVLYLVLSCTALSSILGVIDGIIYLTKPEDQFQRNYRNWFCSGP